MFVANARRRWRTRLERHQPCVMNTAITAVPFRDWGGQARPPYVANVAFLTPKQAVG